MSRRSFFCELFLKLRYRIGCIHNAKVQAGVFDVLKPVQQKDRMMPISLQDKIDRENKHLMEEGHIVKLEECSGNHFVSPIVILSSRKKKKGIFIQQRSILRMLVALETKTSKKWSFSLVGSNRARRTVSKRFSRTNFDARGFL